MKRARALTGVPRVLFRPELPGCPRCGGPLTFRHILWRKHVIRLDGILYAVSCGYGCEACQGPTYRSAEAEGLALKYATFGVDVLVKAGRLRFHDHLSRAETHQALRGLGVPICERHVQNLFESYAMLLSCDRKGALESMRPAIERNGGLLLSLDGIQPDKGNETLYLVREVLTGTVLNAANLLSGNTDNIKGLLRPVLELGWPILGVVSDGQLSIRKAVSELLPQTPYQFCQFHYLRDAAMPFVDADRHLKTEVKKALRGIKEVEDRVDPLPPAQANIVLGFSNALRALILEHGAPPLNAPGVLTFARLQAVKAALQRCLQTASHPLLSSLLRLVSRCDPLAPTYAVLEQEQQWLRQIEHILDPDHYGVPRSPAMRAQGEVKLQAYLGELDAQFRGTHPNHDVLLDSIADLTRGFWPGLFTCFEHPGLPRTNNDLERFIRHTKGAYRRMTGRRSCSDYILRVGEFAVFVGASAESESHCAQRLATVPYRSYRACRDDWYQRREPTRLRFRFKRDPGKFLQELETGWAKLHAT